MNKKRLAVHAGALALGTIAAIAITATGAIVNAASAPGNEWISVVFAFLVLAAITPICYCQDKVADHFDPKTEERRQP